jgi:hypothetical protein
MKKTLWIALVPIFALMVVLAAAEAQAANGTLKFTFKYQDPSTGVVTNLTKAYVYLHDAAKSPPMEKYFSMANYINSAGFGNGVYLDTHVPAGNWYIRITQRKDVLQGKGPYGPPEAGDLTWFQTVPITIVAGQTLDLGTLYAAPFGSTITITGTVKNSGGTPLAGRFVRATTVPCTDDGFNYNINQCGQYKFIALQPTDANGNYTLKLRNPGTYYLSSLTSWDSNPGCSGYCDAPIFGSAGNPTQITVITGESKTADIIGY